MTIRYLLSKNIGNKIRVYYQIGCLLSLLPLSQIKVVFYLESLDYTFLNLFNFTISLKRLQALVFLNILCHETSKLASSSTFVEYNRAYIDTFVYPSFHF